MFHRTFARLFVRWTHIPATNSSSNGLLTLVGSRYTTGTTRVFYSVKAAATSSATLPQHYTMTFLERPDVLQKRAHRAADICQLCIDLLQNPSVPHTPRHILQILDTMSNQLCLVLDAAEFVRHMHSDPRYAESALNAFIELNHYMNVLNTDRRLYDAVCQVLEHKASLTPEEARCAEVFKHDIEANGIHLSDKEREAIAQTRTEIEELCSQLLNTLSTNSNPGQKFAVLSQIRNKRHELAQILREPSFSSNALHSTLARTPERVWSFLGGLSSHLMDRILAEFETLRAEKRKNSGIPPPPSGKDNIAIRDDELPELIYRREASRASGTVAEYLSLDGCWAALMNLCKRTFGISMEPIPLASYEKWDESVRY